MHLIYTARDISEAHIVAGMLNANGIAAHAGGHYLQGGVGELAATDFAHVYLAEAKDTAAAKVLIAEYEDGGLALDDGDPLEDPAEDLP